MFKKDYLKLLKPSLIVLVFFLVLYGAYNYENFKAEAFTVTSFTASPSSIASGGSSTLSWTNTSSPPGTQCSITGNPSGSWSGLPSNGSINVSPTQSTRYDLYCTNGSDDGLEMLLLTVTTTQCSDGIDNDGDGGVDYNGSPADPDCANASDNDEYPASIPTIDVRTYLGNPPLTVSQGSLAATGTSNVVTVPYSNRNNVWIGWISYANGWNWSWGVAGSTSDLDTADCYSPDYIPGNGCNASGALPEMGAYKVGSIITSRGLGTYFFEVQLKYGQGTGVWATDTVQVNVTCTADISVTSNVTGASWNITPGNYTSTSNTVYPGVSGTTYTIGNITAPSGYQFSGVTNSKGGTNSMTMNCDDTASFDLNFVPTPPDPDPSCAIIASPSTISSGQSSTLDWSSSDATSLVASASPSNSNWVGSKNLSGSQSTGSLTQNTIFTATVMNTAGTQKTCNTTVVVNTPTPTLSANTSTTCGGEVLLTWNSVTGATSYKIYDYPSNTLRATVTGTNYTVSGLTPGVSYQFRVKATSSAGDSLYSNIATATASAACPVAFDYSLSNNGNVSVTKGSSAVTGQSQITKTLTAGTTQSVNITATGLPSGVTVSYANRTCNPTCSSTLTFTVQPSTLVGTYPITVTGTSSGTPNKTTNFNLIVSNPSVPSTPTGLNATPGSCGTGQITLSWNSVSGATSYQLYRDGGGTPIYDGASTSFIDSGLTVDSSHTYRVRATNIAGSSAQSSQVAATAPSACVTAPPTPTGFTASPSSCGNYWLNLSWNSASGATSYTVKEGARTVYSGTGFAVSDTNLTPGSTHSYTLTASNSAGTSAPASAGATVSDACPVDTPPTVSFTAPSSGAVISGNFPSPAVNAIAYDADVGTSDGNGIDRVVFQLLQGANVLNSATESFATYDYGFDSRVYPDGSYTIRAIAYSTVAAGGGSTFADLPVTISNILSQPDLTASPTSPTAATAGTAMTLSSTITNGGGGSTGGSFSNFFQVATASGGGGTITNLSPTTMSTLAQGSNAQATSPSYTFPSAGTYSARACTDKTSPSDSGVITETNENNNCSSWTDIAVSSAPTPFNYILGSTEGVTIQKATSPTSGQVQITKTLTAGTTQSVNITATGLPSGVTVSYANRTCNPTCTTTITFTVSPSASAGTSLITVTGSTTGLSDQTTSFNLVITDPPSMSVSCVVSPTSAIIGQQVVWTASVVGGVPPFTYTWSGDDGLTGNSSTVSKAYQSVGAKQATVDVVDNNSQSATCPAGVVQIAVDPSLKEF